MTTPLHITGLAKLSEENSINASFDSIERIITSWQPTITKQNYSIFSYYGTFSKGQKINVADKPFEETPVFALKGFTYIYVGDLLLSGLFVSKIDSGKEPLTIFQIYPCKR